MIHLNIPNISCGHCARAITSAITALDPAATVKVDIESKVVDVDTTAGADQLNATLTAAGYPPKAA